MKKKIIGKQCVLYVYRYDDCNMFVENLSEYRIRRAKLI